MLILIKKIAEIMMGCECEKCENVRNVEMKRPIRDGRSVRPLVNLKI